MRAALFFALTAVIASALAVASDPCLDISWAPTHAMLLNSTANLAKFNGVSPSSLQEAFDLIWAVAKDITTGYWGNLYFGLNDGSFFSIKNCRTPESGYNVFCPAQSSNNYVAYALSPSLIGAPYRTVFKIDTEGQLGAIIGNETANYDPRIRPWWNITGWTATGFTLASGGYGRTYGVQFPGGTVAADRIYREACETCLMSSWAVPASLVLAQQDLSSWLEVDSMSDLTPVMEQLMTIALENDRGYTATLYAGFANDYFYAVRDCLVPENAANQASCQLMKTSFPNARWMFYYQNQDINADHKLRGYAVTVAGTATNPTFTMDTSVNLRSGDTDPYYPTQRPWYPITGWTDQLSFFQSSVVGRTYASPANIDPYTIPNLSTPPATIGADYVSSEPCWSGESFDVVAPPNNATTTGDVCLDVSWAPVHALLLNATANLAKFNGVSPSSLQEAFDLIWAVAKDVTTGYWGNLYFGLNDGSFFSVKNCRTPESGYNPFCPQQTNNLVAYALSPTLIGAPYRTYFKVDTEGQIINIIGNETANYDPRVRPWWNITGWTATGFTLASGGWGRPYALAFPGGTIAADRIYREACETCIMSSWAVPASLALAQQDLSSWATADSTSDLNGIMSQLMTVALETDRGYTATLYAGFANDYFYAVRDCLVPENAANQASCQLMKTSFPNARWMFYYQNQYINSDHKLRGYAVTVGGTADAPTFTMDTSVNLRSGDTDAYYPTQRPWYPITGWSDKVTFFQSTTVGRTYCSPAMMDPYLIPTISTPPVTIGADYVSSEPCWNMANLQANAPPPPPPASTATSTTDASTTDASSSTTTSAASSFAPAFAVVMAVVLALLA